jgi:hypothetical protein
MLGKAEAVISRLIDVLRLLQEVLEHALIKVGSLSRHARENLFGRTHERRIVQADLYTVYLALV